MQSLNAFFQTLNDRNAVSKSLKVAAVVGTILFGINHGSATLQNKMSRDRWISAAFTYVVPFMVSIHGQSMSRQNRHPVLSEIESSAFQATVKTRC